MLLLIPGFAGPAVILNTMFEMDQGAFDKACPEDFQNAEYLAAHGQLDMVIASDAAGASEDGKVWTCGHE